MKKIINSLLILFVIITCSGCKSADFEYGKVIDLKMSNSSKDYAAKIKESGEKEFLSEKMFASIFDEFSKRTDFVWPNVETKNSQEKIAYQDGDVYTLTKEGYDSIVLYIHGGAYGWEASEYHVSFCDDLADLLNAKVYMPNYKLVPQGTYKDAYALLDEVYADILALDLPIYIMGDSAGGGLALAYTEHLIERNFRTPEKQVLISPWVDVSLSNSDIGELKENDITLDTYGAIKLGQMWADDKDVKDPMISPLYGSMEKMPDTLIFIGTGEIILPDNILLFNKMVASGVNVTLVKGEGFWHVFPIYNISEKDDCLKLIKDHISK